MIFLIHFFFKKNYMGHQLLGLASRARMMIKYGNHSYSIPYINMISGNCNITLQNYGYAVDTTSYAELSVNTND